MLYEINLIKNLEIKMQLGLVFDQAEIQSKLTKLLEVYSQNQARMQAQEDMDVDDEDYKPDLSPYYWAIKELLLFFCTPDCMDTFAENNTEPIKTVLTRAKATGADDFILFLNAVVKADLDNESEVEGET